MKQRNFFVKKRENRCFCIMPLFVKGDIMQKRTASLREIAMTVFHCC